MCDKGKKRHMGKARLICYEVEGGTWNDEGRRTKDKGRRTKDERSIARMLDCSNARLLDFPSLISYPLPSILHPPSSILDPRASIPRKKNKRLHRFDATA